MHLSRVVRAAVTVALVVAAMGVSGARANGSHGCENAQVYAYCGDHVPLNKLPLNFSYDGSGAPAISCWAPANVVCSVAGVPIAMRAAMTQWNAIWPGAKACFPLCWNGGANRVTWANFGADGPVAAADLTYDGDHEISRVTITLNSAKPWRIAGGADLATGTASAATAEGLGTGAFGAWYDVESVLLHELGHALGLEDIGNARQPFPYDLTDTPKYTQVMYRWYFRGSVKRVLGAGDIAGAHRAAIDSYIG